MTPAESFGTFPRAEPSLFGVALVVEGHMTHPDPNQCPCTTGRDSFDGMTLLELGARPLSKWPVPERASTLNRQQASDEDGHLEVDDWYRLHPVGDA